MKIKGEMVMASVSPLNRLLEKVMNLIPTPLLKEKEEKTDKGEPPAKPAEKTEKTSSKCPHHFGYLADRPKSAPMPDECLTCEKMLECINKSNSA